VAAGLMLHRVTGEAAYLEQARATADAALDWYGAQGYQGQPAIFVAIFFCNLLPLVALTGSAAYRLALEGYADWTWNDPGIHEAATGLFKFEGPSSACTLLDQAAMVQMLALLAWPEEQYDVLA